MLAGARPQNQPPPRPIRWNTLRILRAEHNADASRSFVAVEWHDSDRLLGTITLHQRHYFLAARRISRSQHHRWGLMFVFLATDI